MALSSTLGYAVSWLRTCAGGLWRLEASLKGVQFKGAVRFEGRPIISLAPESQITISERVSINSATRANPLACFQPSVLRTLARGARITVGARSGMSATVLCAGAEISIGEDTIIGSGAMLLDNDFHAFVEGTGWINEYQANARPIHVGKGVFIGARAIVLKGVTIGDRAIIGAGAVVTRDVPPGALAAGNPAKVFPRRE